MVLAYVALGANLGDACATVSWAMDQLATLADTTVLRCSSLYRTDPVEATGPDFINAVVAINTRLTAVELLGQLQRLEHSAGRQRSYKNAPRTLDLDLLLYGDSCINSPVLVVPHPRMFERAFVLVPLAEIAPERVTADQLSAVQAQRVCRL
jgi:2-amino-4-hydroxy-6-hydroxymethyldihydropteridine diphosphokinase